MVRKTTYQINVLKAIQKAVRNALKNSGAASAALALVVMSMLAGCATAPPLQTRRDAGKSALERLLQTLHLSPEDCSLRPQVPEQDPFLLPLVPHLLKHPLQAADFHDTIVGPLNAPGTGIAGCAALAARLAGVDLPDTGGAALTAEAAAGRLQPDVLELFEAMVLLKRKYQTAFEGLDVEQVKTVKEGFEQLLLRGRRREGFSRIESQRHNELVFRLASRIRLEQLASAWYDAAAVLDRLIGRIRAVAGVLPLLHVDTPHGPILIGGSGDDVYEGEMPFILIDPAGNDIYRFSSHRRFHLIIDTAGDDFYTASNASFPGSGIAGAGFLVDVQGNDRYSGELFAWGCGFMGTGTLADLGGDDEYRARIFCQGAAALGGGLLYDAAGDDRYESDIFSQGLGYVGGTGLLVDMQGNDSYAAGTSVPDAREESGAFQTYAQGFGFGCRMYAAGGAGVLYDARGDDSYRGSYFCQGSSLWYGLGILTDGGGDDDYRARRYAQGAGIHSSLGLLRDGGGSDTYRSWGASQGCGHDRGGGILLDAAGDDRYEAEWSSQGAGISTGLGLLVDGRGSDRYRIENQRTLRGSGSYDERRDAISIGLVVDGAGQVPPDGRAAVRSGGDIGGCIFDNGRRPLMPVASFAMRRSADRYTTDNNTAGSAQWSNATLRELEQPLLFEDSWERAAEALAERGPAVMPALSRYLDVKDVAVRRTVEEGFKKIGTHHLDAVHVFVIDNSGSPGLQRFLLFVLSELARPASAGIFLRFLQSEQPGLQAMALRGLYKLEQPLPADVAAGCAASSSNDVRRYCALCLRYAPGADSVPLLAEMLSDADFQVRYAAFRSLQSMRGDVRQLLESILERDDCHPHAESMLRELLLINAR